MLSATFAALLPQATFAYKCTGLNSAGVADYYKDGVCYQAVGSKCLDNPPSTDGTCQKRDTGLDKIQPADVPVKNDGSAVTDWTCSKGTYNATKKTCETCTAFGSCQSAGVQPSPKSNDTTVDPNASTGSTGTNGTISNATKANQGGSGTCGGIKTDYFSCSGSGIEAAGGLLKIFILIASIGVGIVAVGGIVYAGILYASAQDNQDQVRKSVKIIRGVGIGIALYVLMTAIINWLIPGGVFSSGTSNTNNNSTTQNQSSNTNNSNTPPSTPTTNGK